MIQILPESPIILLEQRLERGGELLFDMEQRGDTGPEYQRFLAHFVGLLADYEQTEQA